MAALPVNQMHILLMFQSPLICVPCRLRRRCFPIERFLLEDNPNAERNKYTVIVITIRKRLVADVKPTSACRNYLTRD